MPLYKLATLPKIAKLKQQRLREKLHEVNANYTFKYRNFPSVTTIYFSILSLSVHEGLKLELQTIPDVDSEGENFIYRRCAD